MTRARHSAVAIGGSAGSIVALSEILSALAPSIRTPMLVVLHLHPTQATAPVGVFATKCRLAVKEAEDKELIRPGTVYFAPPDYHLLVERDFRLSLSTDAPVQFSRPSIDVLFETAADAFGDRLAGIVLSGASSDGAAGLAAIADAGGVALVQDPQTAESPFMPSAARRTCPTALELSPRGIAAYLSESG